MQRNPGGKLAAFSKKCQKKLKNKNVNVLGWKIQGPQNSSFEAGHEDFFSIVMYYSVYLQCLMVCRVLVKLIKQQNHQHILGTLVYLKRPDNTT